MTTFSNGPRIESQFNDSSRKSRFSIVLALVHTWNLPKESMQDASLDFHMQRRLDTEISFPGLRSLVRCSHGTNCQKSVLNGGTALKPIPRRVDSPLLTNLKLVSVLLILVLGNTPKLFAQHDIGHSKCCGRQDVILIRGGVGYWPGVKAMADHFEQLGYAPTTIFGWESVAVADEIAVATSEGRMTGGITIIGYSSGADFACLLASRLEKYNIRVQTMILIEATLGIRVPANVDYCANFYGSRPLDVIPVFRGIPVEVASSQTILYNVDVKQFPQYAEMASRNHFTICNSVQVRQTAGQIVASRQPAITITNSPEMIGLSTDLPSPK